MIYLYTHDVENLMKSGLLPVGIPKCAQQMKKHRVVESPLQLCGYTSILLKGQDHVWEVFNLYKTLKDKDDIRKLYSSAYIQLLKSKHSANSTFVFWVIRKIANESVYVQLC